MRKQTFVPALVLLTLCAVLTGQPSSLLKQRLLGRLEERRMENVVVSGQFPPAEIPVVQLPVYPSPEPVFLPAEGESSPLPEAEALPEQSPPPMLGSEQVQETTIAGGLMIKNETNYQVDIPAVLEEGAGIQLSYDSPQILIIHTHSSEAYMQAGLDRYEASDTRRTEDTNYNIIRIGDELTEIYEQAGLAVIHDREIYDYPSYTGSYTRAGEAVQQYLSRYPGISVVLDIHRDALGANGIVYKTMAEEDGSCASQLMLLVGSDESGLEHPNWRSNLSLALYLQNAVYSRHPTLMRPVSLVQQRYNQHLTGGSLILEVGSDGNTLQEALAAIRLFGKASAEALKALVISPENV